MKEFFNAIENLGTMLAKYGLAVWCFNQMCNPSRFTVRLWWLAVIWVILSVPLPHKVKP